MTDSFFKEKLHKGYAQQMSVGKELCKVDSEHQDLIIFDNPIWGRVMALDGIVQSTERDEFVYSEMFAHFPLFSIDSPSSVLIVGGGDGAILREVVKHKSIEKITLVEIDDAVIETTRQFLPNHCGNAFDDKRLEVIVDDGFNYLTTTACKFDAILCDSTDPVGPSAKLFTTDFYRLCLEALTPKGVFMAQNGVAMLQLDQLVKTHRLMKGIFQFNGLVYADVPTYVGGMMSLAWGSYLNIEEVSLEVLQQRLNSSGVVTKYYNSRIHLAALASPQYVIDAIHAPLKQENLC
jgi:spermidine synthase